LCAVNRRNFDRDKQLLGPHDRRPIARIELSKRDAAFFASAEKNHRRIRGGKDRKRIAGRRRIGDIPSDRSAILNLRSADEARGLDEHRQMPRDERRPDDIGRRCQGANDERVLLHRDLP